MSLQDLLSAIQCIHSPTSTSGERSNAYNTCESFKTTCDNLPLAGLELAKPTNTTVVRHFGYQLLDHFVKFKWTQIGDLEKQEFKNILIKNLMEDGTLSITEESGLIRNILSALVTELLKRDWPQQWMDFLSIVKRNMDGNTTAGEALLTALARLVEDIELDSKLTPARRSDLLRSVGLCKDQLVDMITCKLQEALEASSSSEALNLTCLSALSLLSAASSMTWFHVSSLYDNKSHLCTLLFLLLRDKTLRQGAADVLYNLSARKTTPADNSEFSRFMLQDDALKMVFEITREVCSGALSDEAVLFLKTLCRTYTQLGENHISGVIRNAMSIPQAAFQKYLQLMLIFYQHQMISVRAIVVDLWVHFFNFEQLKKNEDLLLVIPHVVQATQKYFCKPLESELPDDVLDYCELMKIFNILLSKMITLIGYAGKLCPNETLGIVFEWQGAILASQIPPEELCKDDTKPFNVWKFFSIFTEKIIAASLKSQIPLKIDLTHQSLSLLLKFESSDPLISYWHISTINAYVPTFKESDALTIPMLEKLFLLLGKKFDRQYAGVTESRRSAMVNDLHRHTSSCLLRFVTNYPAAITWEVFQEMQSLYNTLLNTIDNKRYGSMLLILEALIAGSNNIPDLEQQVQYIQQLITPLTTFLDTPDLVKHCADFGSFLKFMKITPSNCTDVTLEVKQLRLSLAALCAISKRFTKDGSPKPAFLMVSPYLERVFALNKAINKFWCEETYKDIPWLKGPLEPDKETKMIYCTLLDKRTEGTTFRMNIVALTDYANQLVESLCENLSSDMYKWGAFPNVIMDCYVQFLATTQMPRLKAVLHSVIKPFLVNCPVENYGICLNVLQVTLEVVYKRLSSEWEQIQSRKLILCSSDYSESSAELDEIFGDHMVLIATREYCELLSHYFSKKGKNENRRKSDSRVVNPITEKLVQSTSVSSPLLISVFACMAWGDGVSSNRACAMAHNALKLISAAGMPLSTEATHTFLVRALRALQIHGQHDNCLYTLLNVIIALIQLTYRTIPDVTKEILAQIPSVVPEKIERFFNTLLKPGASDRNLRDSLQSVVSPIICRPISEAGKQHYKIQELGPLVFKPVCNGGGGGGGGGLEGLESLFHPSASTS